MSYVLCLFLGVVIGACATWAALAGSPKEDFRDAGWRRRLGDRLGVEPEDGGAHVCQLPQSPRKVLPLRGRQR